MSKKILTIRVELEDAEAAPWIWDSHRAVVLNEKYTERNGVTVTGIFDDDLVRRNGELQQRLNQYEEEFGELDYEQLVESSDGDYE